MNTPFSFRFAARIGPLLLLCNALSLRAADLASPADQYRALVKEYNAAAQEYSQAYREAKTDAERKQVTDQRRPQPQKLTGRFMELAGKNPADPVAVDALIWVATFGYQSPAAAPAMALLAHHHAASEKLAGVCPRALQECPQRSDGPGGGRLAQGNGDGSRGQKMIALLP